MKSENKPKFYITTPIYYVNGAPHIGSAYTTLACDVMARFKKLDGYDVKFLTGTDEHGQKIEESAEKAGKTPQEFTDEVSETFIDLIKLMNFEPSTFDYLGKYKNNDFSFIRTTNPKHEKVVRDIWRKLVENGWIYRDKYKGWYCVSDEAYYTEDDLVKDEKGEWKTELGKSVEWREEDSYFFRLKEFKEILLALYKYYPDFIQPETRRNEVVSFVEILDRDLSISRNSFDWGIKIPCDLEGKEMLDEKGEWKVDVESEDRHVIYVWLDALFNYISALGGLDGEDYRKYWKGSPNKIHVMGKEIIRFHAVYWPAFLIACEYSKKDFDNRTADENFAKEILDKFILPTVVFAHGFWEAEGRKMSKSFGNFVIPSVEIEWLQKEFGVSKEVAIDYLRYFLITEIPFGNDGNYARQRLLDRINSELVNNIGNLAQRTLSMIYKNCDGKIPSSYSLLNGKPSQKSEIRNNEVIKNYPPLRGGIENPKDFQGGFTSEIRNQKSEDSSSEVVNLKETKRLSFKENKEKTPLQTYGLLSPLGEGGRESKNPLAPFIRGADSANILKKIRQSLNNFEYDTYAQQILHLSSLANEYIEQTKPWELKKTDQEKFQTVLYILAETIRKIAILLQPFCPYSAKKMLQQLKIYEQYKEKDFISFSYLEDEKNYLKSGVTIEEPKGIFPRLEK